MSVLPRSKYCRTPASLLSLPIAIVMGTANIHAAPLSSVDAGKGENKTISGDIAASAMNTPALNAHDGGTIIGQDVTLSSRFDALFRASGNSHIELDRIILGPSFGATVMLSNATFTSGDVLYIQGTGSQLLRKNSSSYQLDTAFDLSKGGSLKRDNAILENSPARNGAALIRATENATVSLNDSVLTSHDSSVLRLSQRASAILQDSRLSASPLYPENIGHYPVMQLNQGTSLDASNVDLSFTATGSALSLDDNATADIRYSSITGSLILKWFTEFGHLYRGDMLTSEQHRCINETKKF